MICDQCGDNQASIHKIQMDNNEVTHIQLCDSCAEKNDVSSQDLKNKNVSDLLTSFEQSSDENTDTCDRCGMTLDEFKNSGRLGCAQCYTVFEEHVEKIIHRIHGAERHVNNGESSTGLEKVTPHQKKQILEKRLQEHVENEAYEEAADLRDRIEELEDESYDDSH